MRAGRLFSPAPREVGEKSLRVLEAIRHSWPTNPYEIAKRMDRGGDSKHVSARLLYHFRRLNDRGFIMMKKVGNTFIVWPSDIERLRVIHELVRE